MLSAYKRKCKSIKDDTNVFHENKYPSVKGAYTYCCPRLKKSCTLVCSSKWACKSLSKDNIDRHFLTKQRYKSLSKKKYALCYVKQWEVKLFTKADIRYIFFRKGGNANPSVKMTYTLFFEEKWNCKSLSKDDYVAMQRMRSSNVAAGGKQKQHNFQWFLYFFMLPFPSVFFCLRPRLYVVLE